MSYSDPQGQQQQEYHSYPYLLQQACDSTVSFQSTFDDYHQSVSSFGEPQYRYQHQYHQQTLDPIPEDEADAVDALLQLSSSSAPSTDSGVSAFSSYLPRSCSSVTLDTATTACSSTTSLSTTLSMTTAESTNKYPATPAQNSASNNGSSSSNNRRRQVKVWQKKKPRWQDPERLSLFHAIVRDKQLDDMTTFHWDKIAKAVGRAGKACKDQWRREILPTLMKNIKS